MNDNSRDLRRRKDVDAMRHDRNRRQQKIVNNVDLDDLDMSQS